MKKIGKELSRIEYPLKIDDASHFVPERFIMDRDLYYHDTLGEEIGDFIQF